MDTAARIVAVCLVGALLAVLLKKTSPDMALLLALAVCLGVLAALTKGLEEVVTFLRELLEWGGLSAELGLTCSPEVTCQLQDGVPFPVEVTMDIPKNAALSRIIAADLGIDEAHQRWRETE